MSENLSVIFYREDVLVWLDAGEERVLDLDAPQAVNTREQLSAALTRRDHGCVFAAPGADIRLIELAVTPQERKHLDASLPFMLEESLCDDIDDLHFARMPLDREHFCVAVIDRSAMARWRDDLGELAGLMPWVPEPMLLPWTGGEWTLLVEPRSSLLRYGRSAGSRIENSLLSMLLTSLSTEVPPQRVVVYGEHESEDLALLPDALESAEIQWRRGGLAQALLLTEDRAPRLNLLQGDFSPQLPYGRWWQQWRRMAALLLVALSVHLLSAWLDLRRLDRENLVLRTEIQSVYREVNPRGAVVDAEKQLRRQLDGLRGGGGGSLFTGLLAPLATVFATHSEMVLASLSYSQRNAELRVNLLASNFADVESLRAGLEAAGFVASLESSSRSGDRVRARLRIGERP